MTARLLDVTPAQYLQDPCSTPSLSASIAHTLVSRSPLHAWADHPKLGNLQRSSTAAQDDGSIIHRLLLGRGANYEIIHAPDWRTKDAKAQRDQATADGKIPVLVEKFIELKHAADTIGDKLKRDFGIVFDGDSEVAIEFTEVGNEGPVLCRAMLDHVKMGSPIPIMDVKKTVSADLRSCSKNAYYYGMDIAHAAYTSALSSLVPEITGRADILFLFVEADPPYPIVPARLDGAFKTLGERRWLRAVQLWEKCLAENRWPSYTDSIATLEAPAWMLTQEEMDDERTSRDL